MELLERQAALGLPMAQREIGGREADSGALRADQQKPALMGLMEIGSTAEKASLEPQALLPPPWAVCHWIQSRTA